MGQCAAMPHAQQDAQELNERARSRGGVVSPADLRDCGFSDAAVRRRVIDGTWQRIGGAVVLTPSHQGFAGLGDQALSWILHLTFGPQTRISGVLALRLRGWRLPGTAHIVVLKDKPHRSLAGVTVLRRPDPLSGAGGLAGKAVMAVTRREGDSTRGADRMLPPRDALRVIPAREALVDCLSVLPRAEAVGLLDTALQDRKSVV